jgi:hydrogenase/urease accessory protein HupE
MRRAAVCVAAMAFVVSGAGNAAAHEVRPGYLELTQTAAETFSVSWKVPAIDDLRLSIRPRLPENCRPVDAPVAFRTHESYRERATFACTGGIVGRDIAIDGLSSTMTDVLVRLTGSNGAVQTHRLLPSAPSFTVPASPGQWEVAATYLKLGVEHILLGVDHLLFVLALLILVRGWRRIIGTVTAFTVAHSLTLAAATLGFVNVPGPPVEAVIALSIVFVACEIVRRRSGQTGLTARWPWIVAFTFGLLHGFGFAGALAEVGLPHHAIPVALLFFNLGVEIGQLMFVAAVLTASELFRRAIAFRLEPDMVQRAINRLDLPAAYAIGAMAAYWLIERTTAFFV